jgi:hypothetical protein
MSKTEVMAFIQYILFPAPIDEPTVAQFVKRFSDETKGIWGVPTTLQERPFACIKLRFPQEETMPNTILKLSRKAVRAFGEVRKVLISARDPIRNLALPVDYFLYRPQPQPVQRTSPGGAHCE